VLVSLVYMLFRRALAVAALSILVLAWWLALR
jgi:hypothetical protein